MNVLYIHFIFYEKYAFMNLWNNIILPHSCLCLNWLNKLWISWRFGNTSLLMVTRCGHTATHQSYAAWILTWRRVPCVWRSTETDRLVPVSVGRWQVSLYDFNMFAMCLDMARLVWFKGLYHRRVFAVWLRSDPVSYEWGNPMGTVHILLSFWLTTTIPVS